MSDYTNSFGAATKDATQATIAAADIGAQLDLVATAVATKSNKIIPAAISNIATLSSSGDLQDGGALISSLFTVVDWTSYGSYASIIPGSDADYTISAAEAKYGTLKISTGSWLTSRNVIVPVATLKQYWIENNSSYNATIKTPAGTGIIVAPGKNRAVYCDGVNVVDPLTGVIPSGAVQHFAMQTVPTGWLECNGSAVSRTTYRDLFLTIGTTFGVGDGATTFNLPNLQGEFIRGWDNGRGVDTGRAFGSAQADQMIAHTHSLPSGTWNSFTMASGGDVGTNHNMQNAATSGSAGAGTETRPRNVALLVCIKY